MNNDNLMSPWRQSGKKNLKVNFVGAVAFSATISIMHADEVNASVCSCDPSVMSFVRKTEVGKGI